MQNQIIFIEIYKALVDIQESMDQIIFHLTDLAEEEPEQEKWLKNKRLKLSCGHHASIGHNLSNTVIIHENGNTE